MRGRAAHPSRPALVPWWRLRCSAVTVALRGVAAAVGVALRRSFVSDCVPPRGPAMLAVMLRFIVRTLFERLGLLPGPLAAA